VAKRQISNLDLKIKLFKEYLDNGGLEKIPFPDLLEDLMEVRTGPDGKVNPETVSPSVNAAMGAILMSHYMPPPFRENYKSEYASTLQKSNSFDQQNIDTSEQFDAVYEEMNSKTNTLFRGQREAKWRLYSTLQRQWMNRRLFESEESFLELLEKIVETGKADLGEKIYELLDEHNRDSQNDIAVLGFLQHHGCPTPLMDWTYSFRAALYFGTDGLTANPGTREIEEYFSVYHIEEEHFLESNMQAIIMEGLKVIGEDFKNKEIERIARNKAEAEAMKRHFANRDYFDISKIAGSGLIAYMTKIENLIGFPVSYFSDKNADAQIKFSLNNSQNIKNQQGVFTWNPDPSKPLELIGDELYKEANPDKDGSEYYFCSCYNIHKSLEPHIRKKLDADGITKDYIYPMTDINAWDVFERSLK
jgi:hypothetical protein